MRTVNGICTSATIFTTNNEQTAVDDYAIAQIQMLCDNETSKGSVIRVMPDVHPGKVGTIGLTMTVGERILPNLVGIDIGCGMTLAKLKTSKVEFQKLDKVIRENIPSGFAIRSKIHRFADAMELSNLRCYKSIRFDKALHSLGTLGGGNHFIEVDVDEEGTFYVVLHSGSRHLGKEVTEYYLNEGQKYLKSQGIQAPYELTWLDGALKEDYFHDLELVQQFAELNREIMLDELVKGMKWKVTDSYSCIHNYVDFSGNIPILRKGAISAKKNETVIIPINMRDGILLGTGLGNTDWNYSAPHGAGRIMKREEIKQHYTVSAYKAEMKGIYSSCIGKDTLDEAPFAYRSVEDITEVIKDTVNIEKRIRPVYNFKAGGQ
ncbi:MAG: RtcB family protein [Lachnospiraceae bacterium]|nr:RtcB family protein [Lachnospiraceae bacterium]